MSRIITKILSNLLNIGQRANYNKRDNDNLNPNLNPNPNPNVNLNLNDKQIA